MAHFQRGQAEDPDTMRSQITRLSDQIKQAETPQQRMTLLGQMGTCQYLLSDPAAVTTLTEAVGLSQELGDLRAEAVNMLRLAIARQYAELNADTEFERAMQLCRGQQVHVDFALQHLAKYWVEQGRVAEAIPLFEEALALRRAKGDQSLIDSTARALEALESDGA